MPEIKELEAIRRAMETTEMQRQLDNQRNRALRFKAGLMFQRALEKLDKSAADTPAASKKQDPRKTGDYYLTDDAALIRFLIAVERNQPPSLYQRLLDADLEKTGDLRKSQFTGILTDLKLTPQDVMSMQRIAGFDSGQKSIKIEDFIKIIKERRTIRQEIEVETFTKVQKVIKKEGWSIAEAFEVFDTDKNDYVDYQELVEGFKKLKIQVPSKHLKSIFAILDEDGNGRISLSEFQRKLDSKTPDLGEAIPEEAEGEQDTEEFYRLKEEEKRAKDGETEKNKLLKDKEINEFKASLAKGKIPDKTDPVKRKQQEEIRKKIEADNDKELKSQLINGELKVQAGKGINIVDVRKQGCNYFYLVFHLEGSNENKPFTSKPIKFFDRETFQWSAKVPMINCHPDEFGDEFNIKIYASKAEFDLSDFVGEVYCKWKPTLQTPNEYAIASYYEL